jgi:hypothetical protein
MDERFDGTGLDGGETESTSTESTSTGPTAGAQADSLAGAGEPYEPVERLEPYWARDRSRLADLIMSLLDIFPAR